MLNYYCLTIIGNASGVDEFLGRISNNKQNSLLLNGLTIFTFETLYDISFIEKFIADKNFLLSKMNDLTGFTAMLTDVNAHTHLFGDYMEQKIKDEMDKFKDELKKDVEDEQNYVDFEMSQSEDENYEEIKEWMQDLRNRDWEFDTQTNSWHRKNVTRPEKADVKCNLTLDELLDKIGKVGYINLTSDEQKLLDNYSQTK